MTARSNAELIEALVGPTEGCAHPGARRQAKRDLEAGVAAGHVVLVEHEGRVYTAPGPNAHKEFAK